MSQRGAESCRLPNCRTSDPLWWHPWEPEKRQLWQADTQTARQDARRSGVGLGPCDKGRGEMEEIKDKQATNLQGIDNVGKVPSTVREHTW